MAGDVCSLLTALSSELFFLFPSPSEISNEILRKELVVYPKEPAQRWCSLGDYQCNYVVLFFLEFDMQGHLYTVVLHLFTSVCVFLQELV